jgi:hypothetical protein
METSKPKLTVRLIGYWYSERTPQWPKPQDFVDESWDELERVDVGSYLSQGWIARSSMGYSPCRICGIDNGDLTLTDGVYAWPNGLAHYVENHKVRLPKEFIEHVLRRVDELDEIEIEVDWWGRQSSVCPDEAGNI